MIEESDAAHAKVADVLVLLHCGSVKMMGLTDVKSRGERTRSHNGKISNLPFRLRFIIVFKGKVPCSFTLAVHMTN